MKTIAFWDNCLCERGTTIALYDYAYYNQTILGNKSIIMYNLNRTETDNNVVERFKKEFKVFGVHDFSEVDPILLENNCDIFYIIKSGGQDNQISKVAKTVVHCVFNCSYPQGDIYASIGPWIKDNNGRFPWVPHMINLPDHNEDMRNQLNIPLDAVVFGRHGGYDTFNIPFAQKIVHLVAKYYPNIYFLFVNTRPFCEELPNIIHLDRIYDLHEKVKFINTCDAMVWARNDGETFGLAIGEFSVKNKPIICMDNDPRNRTHIHLLNGKGIIYDNEESLFNIFTNFDRIEMKNKDWRCGYSECTPEKVMQIFKRVFIDT